MGKKLVELYLHAFIRPHGVHTETYTVNKVTLIKQSYNQAGFVTDNREIVVVPALCQIRVHRTPLIWRLQEGYGGWTSFCFPA
jgi:hypothetical protein